MNYSVFAPQQAGELRVYPGNGVPTTANIVPFKVNETRANNGHLTLSTDNTGTFNVRNASNGTIHFILDVNGYYQ
ncbi:MAG: hypothetical protein IPF66_23835 [Holophagales bacterium]|nr:hypothetical protein [Holophagales bacterium]